MLPTHSILVKKRITKRTNIEQFSNYYLHKLFQSHVKVGNTVLYPITISFFVNVRLAFFFEPDCIFAVRFETQNEKNEDSRSIFIIDLT